MKNNVFALILLMVLVSPICGAEAGEMFSSFERAELHPIKIDRPAIDFFDGALLVNGARGHTYTQLVWCRSASWAFYQTR